MQIQIINGLPLKIQKCTLISYYSMENTDDCIHLMNLSLTAFERRMADVSKSKQWDYCEKCKQLVDDYWVCLGCFHIGCGRYNKKHAEEHSKQYTTHPLCIFPPLGIVYCY